MHNNIADRARDAISRQQMRGHLRKIFGVHERRRNDLFDGYPPVPQRVELRGSLSDITDLDFARAKRILLHTRIGGHIMAHFPGETIDSLAAHMVEASRRGNNKEGETSMYDKTTSLRKLRKAIDGTTEQDRFMILNKMAQADRRDGETGAQAFARFFQDNKAAGLFDKGIAPDERDDDQRDDDERDDDERDDDELDPLEILDMLAERLRRREPSLTKAQAFAKVYQDPANAALAKIERERNGFASR